MIEVPFTGSVDNTFEIGLGYFYAFFGGIALNYFGVFYFVIYWIKP